MVSEVGALRWGVLVLALSLPLLGPIGCTSPTQPAVEGSLPVGSYPASGGRDNSTAARVGEVVVTTLLVGGLIVFGLWAWLSSDDDDDDFWEFFDDE